MRLGQDDLRGSVSNRDDDGSARRASLKLKRSQNLIARIEFVLPEFTYLKIRSFADGSILGRNLAVGEISLRRDRMIPVLRSRAFSTFRASSARRASGLTWRGFRSRATRSSTTKTRLFRDRLFVAIAATVVRHDVLECQITECPLIADS